MVGINYDKETKSMDVSSNMPNENTDFVQRPKRELPYVTLIIIVSCVIAGIMCLGKDDSYVCGALNYDYVVKNHEYGRILSYMFLHDGFEHLSANMISLFLMGSLLEKNYGRIQMVVVYFGSGIISALASMTIFHVADPYNPNHFSVGASGAIFGVAAAVVIADVLQKRNLKRFDIMWAVGIIVADLVISSGENIDSWAHIFGAVAGGLMGLVIGVRKWQGYRENMFFKILAVMITVCLCIIGLSEAHIGDSAAELNDDRIAYVKQQRVYDGLDATFEEVLGSSCNNTMWTIFKTDDERTVVDFQGRLTSWNADSQLQVQFVVSDDCSDYYLSYIGIDDEAMTDDEINDFFASQEEN